jgi:hypothetical protein
MVDVTLKILKELQLNSSLVQWTCVLTLGAAVLVITSVTAIQYFVEMFA